MLQRGKFSKKCGRLGGEWEANWVAEGGWEASWAPLGSILSTGRWSRDVCTIIKEVIPHHSSGTLYLGLCRSWVWRTCPGQR